MFSKEVETMKKIITGFIILFIIFTTIYDLKNGVLQTFNQTEPAVQTVMAHEENDVLNDNEVPYTVMHAVPGSTVLSLAERVHSGSIPVPIAQLVHDFKLLNPTIEPENLQIDHPYKIPNYSYQ